MLQCNYERVVRIRSVARTVSVRRCTSGRAMELINGQESFFGAQQSCCALNPRRQFQVRSFVLFGVWTTVVDFRMEQKSIRRHFGVSFLSASVLICRNRVSRSPFLQNVVSWLRK